MLTFPVVILTIHVARVLAAMMILVSGFIVLLHLIDLLYLHEWGYTWFSALVCVGFLASSIAMHKVLVRLIEASKKK
jgi:divalent metal cation (Fe/Co/Zn/Cd) transporter